MDNSTKKLLEECSVGCKMGIESMEQVQHHVTDAKIAATIEKSCSKHKELEEEISKILLRAGQPEKEPGVIVSTFSWMTTGVKMMTGEDENKQAVKIIMNGCNMGTQFYSLPMSCLWDGCNVYTHDSFHRLLFARNSKDHSKK